nr:hypothetical protein [Acidithiobacillus albertensis]
MPDLVIEKDVGAETLEESPLFFSSKEQCLIDAYAPAPERLDDALVRRRSTRGDQRGSNRRTFDREIRLNVVKCCKKRLERSARERLFTGLRLILVECVKTAFNVDPLSLVGAIVKSGV